MSPLIDPHCLVTVLVCDMELLLHALFNSVSPRMPVYVCIAQSGLRTCFTVFVKLLQFSYSFASFESERESGFAACSLQGRVVWTCLLGEALTEHESSAIS